MEAEAVAELPAEDVGGEPIEETQTVEEPEEGLVAAPEEETEPEAPEPEPDPSIWRVKINGEEREVTQEQALKDYELRQASYERMEQAANKEKKVKQLMGRLQEASPEQFAAFMERIGHDPLAFAEAIAQRYLERAKMSPEQRELEDLRREREAFAREREQQERQQREQQVQAAIPQQIEHFRRLYTDAMDSAGVPANESLREGLIQRMASRDKQARLSGYEIPAQDLLAIEWESLQAASQKFVSGLDEDRLAKVVGDERLKALRQRDLESLPDVRRFNGGKEKPSSGSNASTTPQYRQYVSGDLDAWRRMLDE